MSTRAQYHHNLRAALGCMTDAQLGRVIAAEDEAFAPEQYLTCLCGQATGSEYDAIDLAHDIWMQLGVRTPSYFETPVRAWGLLNWVHECKSAAAEELARRHVAALVAVEV